MDNPYANYPLTIPISFGIKEIDGMYWMRSFTVETLQKRFKLNRPSSTLYLQRVTTYQERQAMDPSTQRALSIGISDYNLDDVKEMFAEVETWFLPENLKELYGVNDSGMLIFNMDFKDLCAKYVDEWAMVKTAIKVVPTTVEIAQGIYEPGVVFYINREANGVILRQREIKRLCRFFKKFDFLSWDQYAMGCFSYAQSLGRILTYEEIKRQMEANRNYNSNFSGF